MEKLTRYNNFISLKAQDKPSNSAEPNKKMTQFEELLASLATSVSMKNKRVVSGK
ncbi:hypothetical protein [Hymenobacter pini]|uniref:hypothetical protein n=1 Tax=Hymenobacter pini TaxID=2880879 RepID=UPI001CF164A5|nr:hypothetical protein [Hymenobacter pini]MCA8830020.1 hypothetical protein [Hymenobacter pini]